MNEKSAAAKLLGSLGGNRTAQRLTPKERSANARKAALAAAAAMTPEERSERARKAGLAKGKKR